MTDRKSARGLALRALSDEALIGAMRNGDELAWGEFVDRFRPLLEAFARRTGIPRWDWDACITDVLDDEALRFVTRTIAPPSNLAAYLVRAAHNRRLRLKRAALVREQYYIAAADANDPGSGIAALCSESTLRASVGPERAIPMPVSTGIARLATILQAELSEGELLLLTWRSAGVPLRQISAWLGISYDAAAKRVLRLCHRLRVIARLRVKDFPQDERREVDRFFRRADALTSGSGKSGAARRGLGT